MIASFRDDRFLLWATVVLSMGVLLPLFLTPFVPLQDLPNHVALASLLSHIGGGGAVSSYHFVSQPYPVPYWLGYMLIFVAAKLGAPLIGAKLVVAAAVLAMPLGLMRLLPSLDRSPRLALWAFALSWDYNLSWGFVAFNLGTGMSFIYIAWAIDSAREPTWRWQQLAKAILFGGLIAVTHAHATVVAAALVGVLALSELPSLRKALRLAQFSLAPCVGLLPWLIIGLASKADSPPIPERLGSIGFSPNAGVRVRNLFEYTLDTVKGQVPESLLGVVFVVLLIGPLLLLAPSRPAGPSWRRAALLYGCAWLLFLTLPASINWPFSQLFIQQRHATLVLALGLALPCCALEGRYKWRLAPGLVAAAFAIGVNVWLCYSFGRRTAPFLEVIEEIPAESKILPVLMKTDVPESRRTPLNQFSAYLIAEKGGYSPYLFDTPNLMVRYDATRHLPSPPWHKPKRVSLTRHVPHYDYVLVQGKRKDPIEKQLRRQRQPADIELRLAKEVDMWRLYEVVRPDPPP